MRILVIGGTGTVGSQVVRELVRRGVEVRVLTRNPEKVKSLPEEAKPFRGDLLDPGTIRSVFTGVDGVFLLNAVSTTETNEGLMALNGARLAKVGRIAYLSVHNVDRAPHLPHFGSKLPIEMVIKEFGVPYAILRANNFYQNDYWFKDVILQHGVYPQPLGDVGVSRVDVRDIAEAAAIFLTGSGAERETYNLVGPKAHTGKSTAEAWTQALGKNVAYGGNDLDSWEKQASQMLPAWMAFDFRMMYSFFHEKGLSATPADVERLTKLLGHPPRSYEAFTQETAKMWQGAGPKS